MKLLLVEDDVVLSDNVKKSLIQEGFAVDHVASSSEGLIAVDVNDYDCLILDIGLPDGSGFGLLKTIRESQHKIPIIVVTAHGQVDDRVKGLNLGADDYLSKPVDMGELVARIRALIRRNRGSITPIIKVGNLLVKPSSHEATVNNHPLSLTVKEFSVLEYLAFHHGQLVTRSMIMEHVWGSDFDTFSNVIDVYIKNIRHKIAVHSPHNPINTIRGKGYILV